VPQTDDQKKNNEKESFPVSGRSSNLNSINEFGTFSKQ